MSVVIQRRGKENKYVSGIRVLKLPGNRDTGKRAANWTTNRMNAQRFESKNQAEIFVIETFGMSAFMTLRCTEVSNDS